MNITIYTDGGSLNNPGQAAIAYLIYQNKKLVFSHGERIGVASNNVAEYTALISAFKKARDQIKNKSVTSISVFADSQLMIRQLQGLYKVKHVDIKPLFHQVKELETNLPVIPIYTHVMRDKNTDADLLVKKALGVER
ncbi:MAG: ribonuclease HI family protein [bacterium]|nr:ribonuclease HI family protein [bacterium]